MLPEKWRDKTEFGLAAILFIAVAAIYFQVRNFGFLHLDDLPYTTENPMVAEGFSLEGIKAAFSQITENYYIPIMWLSLMADSSIYKLDAGGFHFTNLIFHAANTALLFLLLFRLTGSRWKSFFAVALWALHPLRVEAVAWVTSRKDLLSTFFLLLCLFAYNAYAQCKSPRHYMAALALFALGILSKPILVTLPLFLLALDFWPLGRFDGQKGTLKGLLLEKLPFASISALISGITMYGQREAVLPEEITSVFDRLANISTSYTHYILQTLWPAKLVITNRATSNNYEGLALAAAATALILVTAACLIRPKKAPWAAFGWSWYLITLFPVSGIIPVGLNFTADRFTYLPAIGLVIILVWGAAALVRGRRELTRAAVALFAIAAVALATASAKQASRWRDGITLFRHGVETTGGDYFSRRLLGVSYFNLGQLEKAFGELVVSSQKQPMDYMVKKFLGIILYRARRYEEAQDTFLNVLKLMPYDAESTMLARGHVVLTSIMLGDKARATSHLCSMLEVNPGDWVSNSLMNIVTGDQRVFDEVRAYLINQKSPLGGGPEIEKDLAMAAAIAEQKNETEAAIRNVLYTPHVPDYNVGIPLDLMRLGKSGAAIFVFELIAEKPFAEAKKTLAAGEAANDFEAMRILLDRRTIELAGKALEKRPSDHAALFHMAWCQADLGLLEEAKANYEKSLSLQPDYLPAKYCYGGLLSRMGKSAEARKVLSEALADSPGHSGVNLQIGLLDLRQGDFGSAIERFGKSYASDRSNTEALFQKALAESLKGDMDAEATADYLEYLKFEPADSRALFNLGTLHAKNGRGEE
ncbi:tetratricopeptide repeat protein, partial [bacterium]